MYLCHSENLMPKDTKSLGNNKAPACESRGFVLKKKKVRILTHLRNLIIRFFFYRELIKRECLEREIIFYPCLLFLPPNGIETPTNPLTVLEFFPKNI